MTTSFTKAFYFSLITLTLCFIVSCSDAPKTESDSRQSATPGGRHYGGRFSMNENEYFGSLYPHHISDEVAARITSQIYEGLLRFDPVDLSIQPSLATSVSVDQSGKKYTINLKKGVFFHDNACFPDRKGRELTAHDVQYCFDQLCSQDEHNIGYSQFRSLVKGAIEYHAIPQEKRSPNDHVSGIKVTNAHQLTITLLQPCVNFKQILATPLCYIYPREAYEKYGPSISLHAVGTGPFMMDPTSEKDFKEDSHLVLKRNPNYHENDEFGNQLPFLDELEITFVHDKQLEMELFKSGKLHMVYRLPTEEIIHLMDPENHDLDAFDMEDIPEYSAHFLGFNNQSLAFSNLHFRKALSFAIDRQLIVNKVLNGEADEPANYGITPLAFRNYHSQPVSGYTFNPDSAQHYFALISDPVNSLVLNLASEGSRNTPVAEEIKRQIESILGISVTLNFLELPELESEIEHGEIDFFLLGHTYTYPHPQEFLHAFYSADSNLEPGENAFPNITRYSSHYFDNKYAQAIAEPDEDVARTKYHLCEQQLLNDAAVIPLWYDEGYRLIHPQVMNLPLNPMQYRDFRTVYFETATKVKEIP